MQAELYIPADTPTDAMVTTWELVPGLGWVIDRSNVLHYLLQDMGWAGSPGVTYIDAMAQRAARRIAVTLRGEMPPADADCGRLFA